MPEDEIESSQTSGGEGNLPAKDLLRKEAQDEITAALKKGAIQKENVVKGGTPVPGEVPHARERLIVAGVGMVISLAAAVSPWTPDNIRPGMLSIATVVATALVKPFERNG
jgi:hypothetical protein